MNSLEQNASKTKARKIIEIENVEFKTRVSMFFKFSKFYHVIQLFLCINVNEYIVEIWPWMIKIKHSKLSRKKFIQNLFIREFKGCKKQHSCKIVLTCEKKNSVNLIENHFLSSIYRK